MRINLMQIIKGKVRRIDNKTGEIYYWWGYTKSSLLSYGVTCKVISFLGNLLWIHYHVGYPIGEDRNRIPRIRLRGTCVLEKDMNLPFLKYYIH